MSFKMKGYPMHNCTAAHREASAAFQKATYQGSQGRNVNSPPNNQGSQGGQATKSTRKAIKKDPYAEALKRDPKLPEYIKLQKSLKSSTKKKESF